MTIVSPTGDLTEPVTRHAARVVRTFWTRGDESRTIGETLDRAWACCANCRAPS